MSSESASGQIREVWPLHNDLNMPYDIGRVSKIGQFVHFQGLWGAFFLNPSGHPVSRCQYKWTKDTEITSAAIGGHMT